MYRGLSSVVIVVKEVIGVKVICFVDSFRKHCVCYCSGGSALLSVVIVVKEVIVVKVICFVDSYHNFIITTFAIVPADLRSAGIEY